MNLDTPSEIPSRCHIVRGQEILEIWVPLHHHRHSIYVVNAGLWGFFLVIGALFWEMPLGYTKLERLLVMISIGVITALILLCVLAAAVGSVMKQHILVTRGELHMRTTILPLRRRLFTLNDISEFSINTHEEAHDIDRKMISYGVVIINQRGESQSLVMGLKHLRQAQWVRRELDMFLSHSVRSGGSERIT